MTKLLKITAIAGALSLLASGSVALATSMFKQSANIALTASKAGVSTGFKARLASSDAGATYEKPQALKTLTVTFPQGTKFNFKSSAVKQCKASATELVATKGSACPAKSRIGSGSANANGSPVYPKIPESAIVFVGKGKLVFLLLPSTAVGTPLVLEGKVSANKLTTPVPALESGGLSIVITELALKVKTAGSGKQAFVTAGKCTKHRFTVRSSFTYYTGSPVSLSSSSKCKG